MAPFILISPASRGLSLALTQHYLRTTSLPIFATCRPDPPQVSLDHKNSPRTPAAVRKHILEPFVDSVDSVDPARLHTLPLDLLSEESIASAADSLADALQSLSDAPSYLRLAFFSGGVLHPERQPADLNLAHVEETFRTNVIAHLLLIKHFARFLPPALVSQGEALNRGTLAKWVHVSARVGSVSDNRLGGWYSYRASKAALNQVVRTFDLHLQERRIPAVCVGVHPGTVKTDLSREFWKGVPPGRLFEPEDAAAKLAQVVSELGFEERGRIWDWKGEEIKP